MKSKIIKSPFFLLLLTLISCYSIKSYKKLDEEVLTYKISMKKILKIKFRMNPSTGYKWFIKYNNSEFLDSVGYVYKPSYIEKHGFNGVGGVVCFSFKAKKTGFDSLEFIKTRSFSKSKPIFTRKFYVNIIK